MIRWPRFNASDYQGRLRDLTATCTLGATRTYPKRRPNNPTLAYDLRMPYEKQPGAPSNVWAGKSDVQRYADLLGMGWAAPLAAQFNTRMVNIDDLCSGPPPVSGDFTLIDLAAGYWNNSAHEEMIAKLEQWVNKNLWFDYCAAVDEPDPPSPPVGQLPPEGAPEEPPLDEDIMVILRHIRDRVEYVATNTVTRAYVAMDIGTISGAGRMNLFQNPFDPRRPWPMAVAVHLDSYPDHAAHSADGGDPLWWDLGFLSWGITEGDEDYVRFHRAQQVLWSRHANMHHLAYNLMTGVTARVLAIYPYVPADA